MNKKKIIQIIIFLVAVAFFSYALWWMFWRKPPAERMVNVNGELVPVSKLPQIGEGPSGVITNVNSGLPGNQGTAVNQPTQPSAPTAVEPEKQLDIIARGDLTKTNLVVANRIKGAFLSPQGNAINFYNPVDNKFYRLGPDGKAVPLADKEFFNVEAVSWSPDGNKAVLEYPDGSNILYDFNAKRQVTLPRQMTEFDFDKGGDRIAFKWESTLENDDWLGVSSPDGSNLKFVEPLGENGRRVQVNWSPNGQIVATYRKSAGINSEEVFFLGLNGENFRLLEIKGAGFKGKWLEDGKHLLYNSYFDENGSRPNLWITRADPGNIGLNNNSLNLQTWVDKCTTQGTIAYCAVPESLPEGAGYVPEVADNIPDLIYKVDLATGAKTLIARPRGDRDNYTAEKLMVSPDGKWLYFVDKQSGRLYSIQLK